jgi:arsenate reductase (thioredoxin)
MPEDKVLFICVHNSARSQMAEAFLKQLAEDRLVVESAGFEPTRINPLVVAVMKEVGIDLSDKNTQKVFELYKDGKLYSYVITVCDEAAAEKCPIFPGLVTRLHWSFEDPAGFTGTWEEKMEKTRKVRDTIRERVSDWYRATFPAPVA